MRLKNTVSLVALMATMGSAPVFSQDNQDDEDVSIEEVVVTGSRIPRRDLNSPTPVTLVDAVQIERSGINNIGDLLVELPQMGIGVTPRNSQSGTDQGGLFAISLRDLGEERTLTLIDGRRVVSNRPGTSLVSTNTIPDEMVERIEIITGGASAIYGSDAIAGVVNIILKDDFEGARFRVRGGLAERGAGEEVTASATFGGNFADDKGNYILSMAFDKQWEIRGNERDFAVPDLELADRDVFLPDGTRIRDVELAEFVPDLSSSSSTARIDILNANGSTSSSRRFKIIPGTNEVLAVRDFPITDDELYDSSQFQSLDSPHERFTIGAKVHYNLGDNIRSYAQAFFISDQTDSFTNPEAMNQQDTNPGRNIFFQGITLDHPFLPTVIRDAALPFATEIMNERNSDDDPTNDIADINDLGIIQWRKRFFNQGRRTKPNSRDTLRIAVGIDGELADNWSYNFDFSHGRTLQGQVQTPDFVRPNFSASLEIEEDPQDPGKFRCKDANARDRGCVPINIFEGDLTPEQIRWVTSRALNNNRAEQSVFSASIGGNAFELPAGPIGIAAGFEWRDEQIVTRTDNLSEQRGITTSGLASTTAGYNVKEIFGEVRVPLVSGAAFAEYLGIEAAIRYADYSHIGGVVSWKAGGEWAPTSDVRFRAMFARAQRAPNITEAFLSPTETGIGFDDPCDGITGNDILAGDLTALSCTNAAGIIDTLLVDRSGAAPVARLDGNGNPVVFAQDDDVVSRGFTLSNSDLIEETADTITLGMVFTPTFVPGLSMTVDYYDIKIKDAIVNSSRQDTLDLCHDLLLPSSDVSPECAFITRTGLGQVVRVDANKRNQDELRRRGIDVLVRYDFELEDVFSNAPGNVQVNFNWNRNLKDEISRINLADGSTTVVDDLGEIDSLKNRAQASLNYSNGPLSVTWRTVYLGSGVTDLEGDQEQRDKVAQIAAAGLDTSEFLPDFRIPAFWMHHINASYEFGHDGKFRVFGGINNVFNTDPPIIPNGMGFGTGNRSNTWNSLYDTTGRFFYLGLRVDI